MGHAFVFLAQGECDCVGGLVQFESVSCTLSSSRDNIGGRVVGFRCM